MNDTTPRKPCKTNETQDASPQRAQYQLSATLLVYGTLKRGYWNHDRYCRNAIDIRPATTWGRLYTLPAGYPALEIPEEHILAHGTADPLADATIQARIAKEVANMPVQPSPLGEWDLIHGELITFTDPVRNLPPIDYLEGFLPVGHCLYRRQLTLVYAGCTCAPGWVYTMRGECLRKATYLPGGIWPEIQPIVPDASDSIEFS